MHDGKLKSDLGVSGLPSSLASILKGNQVAACCGCGRSSEKTASPASTWVKTLVANDSSHRAAAVLTKPPPSPASSDFDADCCLYRGWPEAQPTTAAIRVSEPWIWCCCHHGKEKGEGKRRSTIVAVDATVGGRRFAGGAGSPLPLRLSFFLRLSSTHTH
jgi:hypothetical protein